MASAAWLFVGAANRASSREPDSAERKIPRVATPTCPFDVDGLPRRGVHWVKPRLVAQIAFTEWTQGGKLRHPRFLGLREDKKPEDVVREG